MEIQGSSGSATKSRQHVFSTPPRKAAVADGEPHGVLPEGLSATAKHWLEQQHDAWLAKSGSGPLELANDDWFSEIWFRGVDLDCLDLSIHWTALRSHIGAVLSARGRIIEPLPFDVCVVDKVAPPIVHGAGVRDHNSWPAYN